MNSELPWLVPVEFRYHKQLVEYIKGIPGAMWQPHDKTWLVPIEMIDDIRKEAATCKVRVIEKTSFSLPDLF